MQYFVSSKSTVIGSIIILLFLFLKNDATPEVTRYHQKNKFDYARQPRRIIEYSHQINNNNNSKCLEGQNSNNGLVTKKVNFDWVSVIENSSGAVNSLSGTTGTGVPAKVRSWLSDTGVRIEDDAANFFGSEDAVVAMETGACGGWDASASSMRNPGCIDALKFNFTHQKFLLDPDQIDIVTPSIRNLDFLNEWREFFQGFHVIIIQDGDQSKMLEIPEWVDYELHKRADIERSLGTENAWIISQKDASIRNYGFLLSKKRYVYTIDDDCRPAYDKFGYKINPLAVHFRNLKTPSTPFMFNTLYDPYQSGSDFVRGYPYSLRNGVPTAVSHGIWMNAPDYDAPTQLMKIHERVSEMHEIVQTVPAGIFFPLCSMNFAFDRKLIGPAIMQGLMGVGQPWARYDDMFSGWASKSVADHLGLGVKSGMPYIRHNKASNPFVNLRKEYKGLWWQELVLRFFMNDVKYSASATTPSKCYRELAAQIRTKLRPIHEYFDRLARSMELWTDFWDRAEAGKIKFEPTRFFKSLNKPINLNDRSKYAYTSKIGDHGSINLNLVAHNGVVRKDMPSQKLKIYVYDLPEKFTLEKYLDDVAASSKKRSNCDWNMNVCSEKIWEGQYSTMRQYGADAILIQKFRAYGNRVIDPSEADIFVVPYPHSSDCRRYDRVCWKNCECAAKTAKELLNWLPHMTESNKHRHLFLLTGDTKNHAKVLRSQPLYVSLGNGEPDLPGVTNIVIPPPNTEPEYQPSALKSVDWTRPREISVFMNVGLVTSVRKSVFALLKSAKSVAGLPVEIHKIEGHRRFTIGPQDVWQKYRNSYFCPILEGDEPFQKRFFDVVLSGCIPVVVAFKAREGHLSSWFRKGSSSYDLTHPFAHIPGGQNRRGWSVHYGSFVVEVDGVDEIIPRLESLLSGNRKKLLEMQAAIGKTVQKLVYGLGNELTVSGDAFDEILGRLEHYVNLI